MNDLDLATELRKFREGAELTVEQMADRVLIDTHRYEFIENASVKPSPDEVALCRNFLNRQKYGPLPPPPWYKTGIWTWVIPALGSALLAMLVIESEGFRDGYSRPQYPYVTLILLTLVLFGLYHGIYWLGRLLKPLAIKLSNRLKKR